jgi:CDP-glycerol glycerophosphotransferase (TagB/SpsB family)
VLASSDILVTDFSSNTFEMAYMNKPTMVYVPGIQYVRQKLPFYKIENIGKYKHLIYCDSLKKMFGEIK